MKLYSEDIATGLSVKKMYVGMRYTTLKTIHFKILHVINTLIDGRVTTKLSQREKEQIR